MNMLALVALPFSSGRENSRVAMTSPSASGVMVGSPLIRLTSYSICSRFGYGNLAGLGSYYRAGVDELVGMIQAGFAVLTSPISIQPDSLVITIGAVSELTLAILERFSFISIEVVVELFMALSFPYDSGLGLSSRDCCCVLIDAHQASAGGESHSEAHHHRRAGPFFLAGQHETS